MRGSTSRRRYLRAAVVAVAATAGGCSDLAGTRVSGNGGDGSGGAGTTGSGTPVVHSFEAEFADGLADFEVAKKSARWTAEAGIDGTSAHVDASGAAETSVLARRGGFRWTGTGTVSVRTRSSTAHDNRNALVTFGGVATTTPGASCWHCPATSR
jgi:hypothetical protein